MLKRIEEGRKPEWSDMEYQCRNWTYFVWLSGDHYIEQHFHNVDVMNWAIGSHPVKAVGMGGRSVRKHGNIWDHFAVEFEYPNGVRVSSKAQQIPGGPTRISERVVGTKGVSYTDLSNGYIIGQNQYKSDCPQINPYVQEHADLIAGIKNGKVLNEGKTVAESAMSLVLGRMAAYTGREIKWDWVMQQSKLDLTPPKYEWCGHAVPSAAVPGVTKLI
jgi:predicted dehydrogenase